MMSMNAQAAPGNDRREVDRSQVRLTGKVFLPDTETTLDCFVTNLSVGGAGLWCEEVLPVEAPLVLYIDGFGRFDGLAIRAENGEAGIKFSCQEAKRRRLEDDLIAFVQGGMKPVTRLRRSERAIAPVPIGHFRREGGEAIPCEVRDISLRGASLKTRQRPAVGEVVHLGQTRGWVVRHSDDGIGVQFLESPAR
jgi:hypothetical protein